MYMIYDDDYDCDHYDYDHDNRNLLLTLSMISCHICIIAIPAHQVATVPSFCNPDGNYDYKCSL